MTARRDEGGAIVVLVALFGVVLLVVAALVVDAGTILQERRELQNGADAAALAVAQKCAVDTDCNADNAALRAYAATYAGANATDGAAAVDSVSVNTGTKQVTVVVSTKAGDDDTVLPYWFGRTVTGERGTTVHARATAAWSFLGRARVIPLAMSFCEWDTDTSGGTVYNVPTVVLFHSGTQSAGDCEAQSGQDLDGDHRLPGGFGWLSSSDCEALITAGQLVGEDPGVDVPSDCDLSTLMDTTVLVPIFDDVNGLGGVNGQYHIEGFGEFHLTGYRFAAHQSTPRPCNPPASCIGGYFTRFVSVGEAGGTPVDRGAYRVSLVS